MLTKTNKITCDDCGKFIPFSDLADGRATHFMTNPDAYGFEETYESQCAKCRLAAAQKSTHEG